MSTTPTPALMARFTKPQTTVNLTPETPTDVTKTKHLRPRMVVRAYFNGEPHGGERIVATVEKATSDGAEWTVTFSSLHPQQTYRAAYRWLLVRIEEPEPLSELEQVVLQVIADSGDAEDAHLTHTPFAEVLA